MRHGQMKKKNTAQPVAANYSSPFVGAGDAARLGEQADRRQWRKQGGERVAATWDSGLSAAKEQNTLVATGKERTQPAQPKQQAQQAPAQTTTPTQTATPAQTAQPAQTEIKTAPAASPASEKPQAQTNTPYIPSGQANKLGIEATPTKSFTFSNSSKAEIPANRLSGEGAFPVATKAFRSVGSASSEIPKSLPLARLPSSATGSGRLAPPGWEARTGMPAPKVFSGLKMKQDGDSSVAPIQNDSHYSIPQNQFGPFVKTDIDEGLSNLYNTALAMNKENAYTGDKGAGIADISRNATLPLSIADYAVLRKAQNTNLDETGSSYSWEDSNGGILLLSAKAQEKEGWKTNPNKRKDSEKHQKSGERERNVRHPEGEEHSRVPKGSGGRAKSSKGPLRADTLDSLGQAILGGAAAAGAGYLIYRGVRMLPSLLPPMWWTIPVNLAAP